MWFRSNDCVVKQKVVFRTVVIFILLVVCSLLLPCKSVDERVCLTTQVLYVIYLGLLRALIAKFGLRE